MLEDPAVEVEAVAGAGEVAVVIAAAEAGGDEATVAAIVANQAAVEVEVAEAEDN